MEITNTNNIKGALCKLINSIQQIKINGNSCMKQDGAVTEVKAFKKDTSLPG